MTSDRRRIVVTGMGAFTAIGTDRDRFWQELIAGRSGIGDLTTVDTTRLGFTKGAEIAGFRAEAFFDDDELALRLDRFAQFALLAAREAHRDAFPEGRRVPPNRVAVVTGSSVGGQGSEDEQFSALYERGARRLHPLTVPRVMANSAACLVGMDMGITGPTMNVSSACSSANHAIAMASRLISSGDVDVAFVGGTEAPFSLGHLKAWEALRVIAPDTCRPFSLGRKGTVLGEGAAILTLEDLKHARHRGARVYAELVGTGMSSDASHLTHTDVQGPIACMEAALRSAQLEPRDIDFINAHGTGTVVNDRVESAAISTVFGDEVDRIPVTSTKGAHGHALGATGALEAVATILGLEGGLVPPTANLVSRDPECGLHLVSGPALPGAYDLALSNTFAFGGLNVSLVFRRGASS